MAYQFGDFSFLENKGIRETLEYDFKVINEIDGFWEKLKQHPSNQPFYENNNYNKLELSPLHSGASRALSLRTFENIAKEGWKIFVARNTIFINHCC